MSLEPTLVFMEPDLLDQVLEIEQVCFGDPWPTAAFKAEMAHPWSWFKTIGSPGPDSGLQNVHGFVICWLLPGDMHLLNLAVLPHMRGRGLARTMLQDAEAGFARAGGGVASLEVRPSNKAARSLYGSLGYQQVGIRKKYYRRDNEDALVLLHQVDGTGRNQREAGG